MHCPSCPEVSLLPSARQGIEIDCCPQCRGIWLDRGELEQLLERSLTAPSESAWSRPVFVDSDDAPGRTRKLPRRSRLSEFLD